MRSYLKLTKKTVIALGVALPFLTAQGIDDAPHAPGLSVEANSAATYKTPSRNTQNTSPYDLFIQKLEDWLKNSKSALPFSESSGDEIRVRLGHSEVESAIGSLKHIKKYRDAVEQKCKGIDESAELLVNTLDHCLVKNVLFPSVQKSQLVQDSFELKLSAKALGACQQELETYFSEKEKRTSLVKGDHFSEDSAVRLELASLFDAFFSKHATQDKNAIASSELIKALKKVELKNLCDAKLDEKTSKEDTSKEDKSQSSDSSSTKKSVELPKAEYKERIEETIEEEEQYVPIAPKKIVEEAPVVQPAPQPVQAPRPTYQPQPYQPQPYQPKKKPTFEPVPPRPKNNTPFVPVAPAPAPRGVVGGGPAPIAPFPIARGGFGLSLGFGTYSSTVTAPLIPPPMPFMPPMPPPIPLGMGGGGGLTGISTGPRACLVCSTVTPSPMPTLGLGTMMARPCPRIPGQQPIGACLPNWNQPIVGYPGINPNINQIPRFPGQPVNPRPGVGPQPSVGGGSVTPNRTTVPRVNPAAARRVIKRCVRR